MAIIAAFVDYNSKLAEVQAKNTVQEAGSGWKTCGRRKNMQRL